PGLEVGNLLALAAGCPALSQMGRALEAHAWQRAIAHFEQATAGDPQPYAAHVNLAYVHRKQGAVPQARRDLDQAIRLQPQVPELYLERGTLLVGQAEYELAMQDVQKILALRPSPAASEVAAMAALLRCRILLEKGDFRGVLQASSGAWPTPAH